MALAFKSKLTVKLPELDFTKTLEETAKQVIIPDMRLGINRGIGIDNRPFPKLEASTIARKAGIRKKVRKIAPLKDVGLAGARGGTQTLVDTGELRDQAMEQTTVKRNHVKIFLDTGRDQIGRFLQIQGVGKKKKKFHFFGISQRAEFQAISKMNANLQKILGRLNG